MSSMPSPGKDKCDRQVGEIRGGKIKNAVVEVNHDLV